MAIDLKTTYVIFDLDNCLVDDAWRRQYIKWDEVDLEKRYDGYHAAAENDVRHIVNARHLCAAIARRQHPIFLTSRPVKFESETRKFIEEKLLAVSYFAPKTYTLIMRNLHDHRSSVIVKQEMLHNLRDYYSIDLYQIVMAYDDRPDIVEMYRANGVPAEVLKIHDICMLTPPEEHLKAKELISIQPRCDVADPMPEKSEEEKEKTAADFLSDMANTYRERNKVYGDNYKRVAKLVDVLWPGGVPPDLVKNDQWHLFELMLVKLSRYAVSNLTHQDSIHDAAVYGAMCEAVLYNQTIGEL